MQLPCLVGPPDPMLRPSRPISAPDGPSLPLRVARVQVVVPSACASRVAHLVAVLVQTGGCLVVVRSGSCHQVVLLVLAAIVVQVQGGCGVDRRRVEVGVEQGRLQLVKVHPVASTPCKAQHWIIITNHYIFCFLVS